jgi:hypothetical protein
LSELLGQTCKHGQLARSCEICEKDRAIDRLRAQLQNCIDHLHHINRRYPREDMTKVIEAGNKALYETLVA